MKTVLFTSCGPAQVRVKKEENIEGLINSLLNVKSVKNYISFDVKLQRKSIALYQTLNDRNMLHDFHTV